MFLKPILYITFLTIVSSALIIQTPLDGSEHSSVNDGIHLAVGPRCGQLSGGTADTNAGIDPGHKFETLVSFGDSYTDGGKYDGSPLAPAIVFPPNPEAGGRPTNGLTWVEGVANDLGATLKDYAQGGACIDISLWPSNPRKLDFLGQMNTFLGQSNQLDPETTLYSIFFGINDYLASLVDGDHMQAAAQTLLKQISILASPPTNARYFMVLDDYGRGITAPQGELFKQTVFSGLNQFHQGVDPTSPLGSNSTTSKPKTFPALNVAYVDFFNIWNGVLGSNPGYQAFGYTSTDSCTQCGADGCTTNGMCDDPEHYFYWIPGHPSKETHRIMADYVREVLTQCRAP